MSQPQLSVIIPTFNPAAFIGQCVGCVLDQGYDSIEVLVVDDGSTDDTPKALARYRDRIRYHHQENQGQAVARAWGLEHTTAELVCLLDSDDYWSDQFLATMLPVFADPEIGIAFADHARVDQEGNVVSPASFDGERKWIQPYIESGAPSWTVLDDASTRRLYLDNFPPSSSGAIFRRRHVRYLPDRRLRRGDDYLFFMDLVLGSRCQAAFTTEVLWNLRTHGSNIRQQNREVDVLLDRDIFAKRELIRRQADNLNPSEIQVLNDKIAMDYIDWGYALSNEGRYLQAAKYYFHAIASSKLSQVTPRALVSLAKLPLKSILRPKNTKR